jgi:chromosome segregation ATPase
MFPSADQGMQTSRNNTDLTERSSALDIALQQVEHESAQVQFLSAESRALSGLAIDQGSDIQRQSAIITQLEGQLSHQKRAFWTAVDYGEQHERDARAYRQEVARLEERIEILITESNVVQSTLLLNLNSAHVRERQLCDTLYVNQLLLSEAQAALCIAEETSRARQQSLSLELGACAKQREQAEMKALYADRTMLNLRKELAVAFRNAREAKEQFESQRLVLCERDATIQSLNSELLDVRDQLRSAEDEIDRLRSDLDRIDVWKPVDAVVGLRPVHESPSVPEWCGWLREAASVMSIPATQRRARSPDMSLEELECVGQRASIQAYPTPPDETPSCLTTPTVCVANLDDPFLVDTHTQPTFQLRSPTLATLEVTAPFATSGSISSLCSTRIIDELRKQVAHLEASLVECRRARAIAEKPANEIVSELVQTKEMLPRCRKEADAIKVERDAIDMQLSQAILLSPALQDRVMDLEQCATNVAGSPSDGSFPVSYFTPWCSIVTHEQRRKANTA